MLWSRDYGQWGGLRTEQEPVPTPRLIEKVAELVGKLYDDGFEHPSTCIVRPSLLDARYGVVQVFLNFTDELPPEGVPRMQKERVYQFATRRYMLRESDVIDAYLHGMRTTGEEWRVYTQDEDPDGHQRHTFWNLEEMRAVRNDYGETCALLTFRTYTTEDQEALDFMHTLPVAKREDVVPVVPVLPQESDDEE